MSERSCTDCRWARFTVVRGSIASVVGRCIYQVEMPLLPAALTADPEFRCDVASEYSISHVYPHENCQTWAPKEESDGNQPRA